ncbi:GtrA family protein [Jannaschia seohaensis]|uniref:Flippase GtrA (Transmembrane translocase of bactoprenol-linked glucose) n=1 Tax=Jannaschia seohaensis TaxID=475081 RepID=A0A2Y9B2I7_9RHOB|nr:GtrA family protein [Jannaschia seohaensis]PWJ16174.1 putative flippase GtrA [Jannaschia seohaensis]SSA49177.1 Putative flippase GtrA (transmembrane translocase of bactoprenol-linked glucose) [Jannaschia seohaensis]
MGPSPSYRMRRALFFVLAGSAGFVVDAGVLMLGLWAGLPAWAARGPSFLLAVITTWAVNRTLTFRTGAHPSLREFGGYLAAMSLGLAANYGLYLLGLILGLPPLAALAGASIIAMGINYLGARRVLDRS